MPCVFAAAPPPSSQNAYVLPTGDAALNATVDAKDMKFRFLDGGYVDNTNAAMTLARMQTECALEESAGGKNNCADGEHFCAPPPPPPRAFFAFFALSPLLSPTTYRLHATPCPCTLCAGYRMIIAGDGPQASIFFNPDYPPGSFLGPEVAPTSSRVHPVHLSVCCRAPSLMERAPGLHRHAPILRAQNACTVIVTISLVLFSILPTTAPRVTFQQVGGFNSPTPSFLADSEPPFPSAWTQCVAATQPLILVLAEHQDPDN